MFSNYRIRRSLFLHLSQNNGESIAEEESAGFTRLAKGLARQVSGTTNSMINVAVVEFTLSIHLCANLVLFYSAVCSRLFSSLNLISLVAHIYYSFTVYLSEFCPLFWFILVKQQL